MFLNQKKELSYRFGTTEVKTSPFNLSETYSKIKEEVHTKVNQFGYAPNQILCGITNILKQAAWTFC